MQILEVTSDSEGSGRVSRGAECLFAQFDERLRQATIMPKASVCDSNTETKTPCRRHPHDRAGGLPPRGADL
jgi:hypothetical protein